MALICIFFCAVAILGRQVVGDFDLHSSNGEVEYIYHEMHNLLLAIQSGTCYFAHIEDSVQSMMEGDFLLQLQDQMMSVIHEEVSPQKETSTRGAMQDVYGDVLADFHCQGNNISTVWLDYLRCDFERFMSLCAWTWNIHTALQWQFHRGRTPTLLTGPDNDHTLANGQGQYIYLEANEGSSGDAAEIVSPAVNASTGLCLQFWYSMHGAHVGQLAVYAVDSKHTGHNLTLWSMSHDQGQGWTYVEVTVPSSSSSSSSPLPGQFVKLHVRATRGDHIQGDIAIDDLSSWRGPCSSAMFDCSFEDDQGLCEWLQKSSGDSMDWRRRRGHAVTSENNLAYLHLGHGGSPGDTADLQSPVLKPRGDVCLHFWYIIRGVGGGHLALIVRNNHTESEQILWQRAGSHATTIWTMAQVTVHPLAWDPALQVVFRATRGSSQRADVAIDLISGRSGSCEQHANAAALPIVG